MKYLPFLNGKYTVKPGLKPINKATGIDRNIFQFDENHQSFLENKDLCRKENISKYYCEYKLDKPTRDAVIVFIIERLQKEYPHIFYYDQADKKLKCNHTGEELRFLKDGSIIYPEKYISLFDMLCCQVQEDLAIFSFSASRDWLSAVHLCAPNHWSAEEKIGLNFDMIHDPIPGMEQIRKHYFPMLKSVIEKGPYYRFGWGLGTDNRLNHHPQPPKYVDAAAWYGRRFNPENPKLYIRTERQTLTGFREHEALLFTIRTYFYDVNKFTREEKDALIATIDTMSPDSIAYKGFENDKDDIVDFLHR